MHQYLREGNALALFVKPSPVFMRLLMFVLGLSLLILPTGGMISYIF